MSRVLRYVLLSVAALGASVAPAHAEINLNIYGSADYIYNRQDRTDNQFAVPKLSLLYNQNFGRLSFLAELLLEVGDDNNFAVDLDRVELAYRVGDWLRIRAGRFHSAVGYYNDAYHHAAYFMPTIDRPQMAEDSGDGLLPGFGVGVAVDGRIRMGEVASVRYDVQVANSRGKNPDQTQSLYDLQNPKAVILRLRLEPGGAMDGLIIGGNVVFNWIPGAEDSAYNAMHERMYGGHLVYLEHNVHFISEFLWVEHEDPTTQHTYREYGVFGEVGYNFGNWLPVVRYERLRFLEEVGDPFYRDLSAEVGSSQAVDLSLKYTFNEHVVAKLGGAIDMYDTHSTAFRGNAQIAFAF